MGLRTYNSAAVLLVPIELYGPEVCRIGERGVLSSLKVVMRLLIVSSLLLLVISFTVTATPISYPLPPGDPRILIDTGGDALPLSTNLGVVQPCGAPHCAFDFFNDLGVFVTSFTFEALVNKDLQNIQNLFTCADPSHFFMGCTVDYTAATGDLKFLFAGVVVVANGVDPPGPHGIPPGANFFIALDGWVDNETIFPGGDPPEINGSFTTITTSPEPSAWLTLGTGLMLLAGMAYRRRRVR